MFACIVLRLIICVYCDPSLQPLATRLASSSHTTLFSHSPYTYDHRRSRTTRSTPDICTNSILDFSSPTLGSYIPYTYDAVHALVRSVHAAIKKDNTVRPKGKALMDELKQVTFTGVTGSVAFASTGDRAGKMEYLVFNHDGDDFQWIGTSAEGAYTPCHLLGTSPKGDCHNTTFSTPDNSLPIETVQELNAREEARLCDADRTGADCACRGVCVPSVLSASPDWLSPFGGDIVTITGENFGGGDVFISVTIGGILCGNVTVISTTTISCISPGGVGGPRPISVNANGKESAPKFLLSYHLPELQALSTGWGVEGTVLDITGANFVDNSLTRCRIGSTGPVALAVWNNAHRIRCTVPVGTLVGVQNLYLSNDGGARWASGFSVQSNIHWYQGLGQPTDGVMLPPTQLTIGLLAPVNYYLHDSGVGANLRVPAEAAVQALNAQWALLPSGFTLKLSVVDNNATLAGGIAGAQQLVSESENLIGIVGGYFSLVTVGSANVSTHNRVPFIGCQASSSVLEIKDGENGLPYFVRIGGDNRASAAALVRFAGFMGWQTVAIVSSNDVRIRSLLWHCCIVYLCVRACVYVCVNCF